MRLTAPVWGVSSGSKGNVSKVWFAEAASPFFTIPPSCRGPQLLQEKKSLNRCNNICSNIYMNIGFAFTPQNSDFKLVGLGTYILHIQYHSVNLLIVLYMDGAL